MIKHGTTVADTVTTVILDKDYNNVEVLARGDSDIYFRVDGLADPVVNGDNCYVCVAGGFVLVAVPTAKATQVKLISDDATDYTVTGVM